MDLEWTIAECTEHMFCKTASDGRGTVDHMCGNTHYFTTFAEQQRHQYFHEADWQEHSKKVLEYQRKQKEALEKKDATMTQEEKLKVEEPQITQASQASQDAISSSDKAVAPAEWTTRAHRDSSISIPEHMILGQILPAREEIELDSNNDNGGVSISTEAMRPPSVDNEDASSQGTDGGVRLFYSTPLPTVVIDTTGTWETIDGNAVRCGMIAEEDKEEESAGTSTAKPDTTTTTGTADQGKTPDTKDGDKLAIPIRDEDKFDAQELHHGKPSTPKGEVFPPYGTFPRIQVKGHCTVSLRTTPN